MLPACLQDLFYTTILAALMGYTRPCKTLARAKPVGRVLSSPLMVSLVLQLAVIIVFQVCVTSCRHVRQQLLPLLQRLRGPLQPLHCAARHQQILHMRSSSAADARLAA